jgi:aminoglycoside 3-N-acetyltransferase
MSRVKAAIPLGIRRQVRALRRFGKRLQVRAKPRITRQNLHRDLVRLRVRPGDTLLVHCALSRIGFVEEGPDAVIGALTDAVGPQGTLCMPSFPFDTYVADYLRASPQFDVRSTPSRMGKVTEVFRQLPGTLRSVHPTHPLAARGPHALQLTSGHLEAGTTFGLGTPFHTLCALGGKILLLGVDFHSMTNLHVVEDVRADFPYRTYLDEPIAVQVTDLDGRTRTIPVRAHDPSLSSRRDCNKMEAEFLAGGVLTVGRVGEAEARLLDAAGVLTVMSDLAARGFTMYDDASVTPEQKR